MVDLLDDPDCPRAGQHRELEKAEIKKSEEAIQRVLTAVRNFTNPFTITEKNRLYSLASGAPVPVNVEMDVLSAEAVGEAAKAEFVGRLLSGEPESFFNPVKKNKLKTMEACNKRVTLMSSQGKVNRSRWSIFCCYCITDSIILRTLGLKFTIFHLGHSVSGARQPCFHAACQVTETRQTTELGGTHEVLPDACASQPWNVRWLFL